MEDAPQEYRADADTERPDFDVLTDPADVVRGGHTRDKIYSTVLQLTDSAPVSEIADRAGTGPDAARQYVRWFEDMGLVRKTGDNPEEYIRNPDYLRWRRANRLAEEYLASELVQRLQDVTEEIEGYQETFDAHDPGEIVLGEIATERDEDVADVWKEVSAWETAERRRGILEEALRLRRNHEQSSRDWGSGDPPEDDHAELQA